MDLKEDERIIVVLTQGSLEFPLEGRHLIIEKLCWLQNRNPNEGDQQIVKLRILELPGCSMNDLQTVEMGTFILSLGFPRPKQHGTHVGFS